MNDDRDWPASERPGTGLDDAIDRAVRRIMDVEPPPGLRRRVFARLEAPAPRVPLLPGFAYAGAALALMVLATFVVRNVPSRPVEEPPRPVEVAQAPPATPPASPVTRPAPPASPTTPTRPGRSRAPRAETASSQPPERRVSAASLVDDDLAAPALPAGANPRREPPALPPQAAIETLAPIEIPPLVIQPLRIEPIPPPK